MSEENNNEPVISDTEMKMPEGYSNPGGKQETSHLGTVLAILIVILILLLGGLYLWGTTLNTEMPSLVPERPTAEENNEPESNNAEAEVETQQAFSTSDTLEALEADLDSTNLDDLDAEFNAIEAELDAN